MAVLVWFRRDFRLADHTALRHALADSPDGVVPVFVFDDAILRSPDCGGPIVKFMLGCLSELQADLRKAGGDLILRHGRPVDELLMLAAETKASGVYFNKDYAPAACERDHAVEQAFGNAGLDGRSFKDQVVFEEQEILSAARGEPYTVYTPYRKSWMKKLQTEFGPLGPEPLGVPPLKFPASIKRVKLLRLPTAEALGHPCDLTLAIEPGESAAQRQLQEFVQHRLADYPATRNLPALATGSSRLSPHLRHGTVSPRQCLRAALTSGASADAIDCWIGELIWREFYQQILFNFPEVEAGPFKPKYAAVEWSNSDDHFRAWCEGRTGYPIVDAAMRQLNTTGWMHNRLRMIAAMFLVKDLQINWQQGERYFMQTLIDGETAQNNGNWQWTAGTGTDAQPYFRIFNPTTQSEKFDPAGDFIRSQVPALQRVPAKLIHAPYTMTPEQQKQFGCVIGVDYPVPIVDHAVARARTLAMFRAVV